MTLRCDENSFIILIIYNINSKKKKEKLIPLKC